MEATSIIALVISVLTIAITIWNVSRTNQLTMKNHQTIIFSEYTRRYQDILLRMPDSMFLHKGNLTLTPDVCKYLTIYFDLCSEEFHLHKNGDIPDDIWENWVEGMRITMKPPIYRTGWKLLSSTYNEDFIHFMHQKIFSNSNI